MRYRTVDDILIANHRRAVQEFMEAYRVLGRWKRWMDSLDGPTVTTLLEAMTADLRSAVTRAEQSWQEVREAVDRNSGEADQT
jgi:hypothetical protein